MAKNEIDVDVNKLVGDRVMMSVNVVGDKKLRFRMWITIQLLKLINLVGVAVEVEVKG